MHEHPYEIDKPMEIDPEGVFRFYKAWLSERDHNTRGDVLFPLEHVQFLAAQGYKKELALSIISKRLGGRKRQTSATGK